MANNDNGNVDAEYWNSTNDEISQLNSDIMQRILIFTE